MSKTINYGTATVKPDVSYAGEKGQWEIKYFVGESGIKQGGSIRIIPPTVGTVLWQIGKVMAFCSNPAIFLEVNTEKIYPLSYHHSNYPAITVKVYGGDLKQGETIRILIGAIGGYVSGRFIQTTAQTHSGTAEFCVFVDPKGNANFSRERIRVHAYNKVEGKLNVEVKPSKAAKIRCTIRNSPGKGKKLIGVISVEDEYENPIVEKEYDISLFVEKGNIKVPAQIKKDKNKVGTKFIIKNPGNNISWVGTSCWQNGIYGTSNPVSSNFFKKGYKAYFGDMHLMTGCTGCEQMVGDTEGALKYARDVFGLDFTTVTNIINLKCWSAERKLFKKYNKNHEFVT